MLAFIRGVICAKEMGSSTTDRLVLEVSGIGFELAVSRSTLLTVGQIGDNATLHTSLVIRENDWTIFGFANKLEQEMFVMVQSVNGVGPKLALALVSTLEPQELASAIMSDNHKLISQTPGVGLKMAQRLTLELKNKIEGWDKLHADTTSFAPRNSAAEEAQTILAGLGYTATEITLALKQSQNNESGNDTEALVRQALRTLGTSVTKSK